MESASFELDYEVDPLGYSSNDPLNTIVINDEIDVYEITYDGSSHGIVYINLPCTLESSGNIEYTL